MLETHGRCEVLTKLKLFDKWFRQIKSYIQYFWHFDCPLKIVLTNISLSKSYDFCLFGPGSHTPIKKLTLFKWVWKSPSTNGVTLYQRHVLNLSLITRESNDPVAMHFTQMHILLMVILSYVLKSCTMIKFTENLEKTVEEKIKYNVLIQYEQKNFILFRL